VPRGAPDYRSYELPRAIAELSELPCPDAPIQPHRVLPEVRFVPRSRQVAPRRAPFVLGQSSCALLGDRVRGQALGSSVHQVSRGRRHAGTVAGAQLRQLPHTEPSGDVTHRNLRGLPLADLGISPGQDRPLRLRLRSQRQTCHDGLSELPRPGQQDQGPGSHLR